MLCEDLRIDEAVYIGDDGGFWMGLEHLVGVLEFQVVGQGEQVPALMEKGPKVGAVAPANILKDAFIQFKGGIFEVEGEVLVKEEAGEVGILGLEIQFVVGTPFFKEGVPGGSDGDVDGLVEVVLLGLLVGFARVVA